MSDRFRILICVPLFAVGLVQFTGCELFSSDADFGDEFEVPLDRIVDGLFQLD